MRSPHPLEPSRAELERAAAAIVDRAAAFVQSLPQRPASSDPATSASRAAAAQAMLTPPPEHPGDLAALLDRVEAAATDAVETAAGRYFGFIPGGGLVTSAAAETLALTYNRHVGMAAFAPALVALEQSVVRWLCTVCGMPEGAGGLLTTGGSVSNLSAVVAARYAGLGENLTAGTLYVSAYVHHSIQKAARIAGLPSAAVRVVPTTDDLRIDVPAAASMIRRDRERGRRPFLLVGSAGSTHTGVIDPLPELADLAAGEGLWLHVDGAYGGLFALTERGRERLDGLHRADSITLDPHKAMFLPYGTGALLVRDPQRLAAAHSGDAPYLQDLDAGSELPDFASLGIELSREWRGLRVWLPLHLHGLGAFRAALDEKLDLTWHAYQQLAADPALEVIGEPDLTIVGFRLRDGTGDDNRALLDRINASRRVFLSSTSLEGRFLLRLCVLSHRTHREHVDEAVRIIRGALHQP